MKQQNAGKQGRLIFGSVVNYVCGFPHSIQKCIINWHSVHYKTKFFFMKAPCKVHLILKTYLKNDIPVVEVRVEVVHTWPHTQAVHPVPVHLNRGRSTTVPVHLDRGRSTTVPVHLNRGSSTIQFR